MERCRHTEVKAGFGSRAARRLVGSSARRRLNPHLESLESRRLLSGITEILVPSGIHAGPVGITAGPGGSLWFTEYQADKIGVINPRTDTIEEFSLPTSNARPLAITQGPDGNMWFTESGVGKIGTIDLSTHAITEYPLSGPYAFPFGITSGPDNSIWFTEQGNNLIGTINIASGSVTEFPIPTSNSVPEGITLLPGGAIWFTESLGNQIGMIDPSTHAISEFGGLTALSQPKSITVGSDGNLWFTEYAGNRIGMIDPSTHAVSEFSVPTASSTPNGITAGPGGKLYFTEYTGNKIGAIDPTTHRIMEITVPTAGSQPVGIVAGALRSVWFAELNSGNLGIVRPDLHVVVTGPATSSLSAGSPFTLTIQIEDDSNTIDTDYDGPVSVSVAAGPNGSALNGTLTAMAVGGVATLSGLVLNDGGNYTLEVSTNGAASALMNLPPVIGTLPAPPVTPPVAPSPPPEIIGAQLLTRGKGARKAVVGIKLVFSGPLAAATAQNATNYTLTQSRERGRQKVVRAIRFRAVYDPAGDAVSLLIAGKPQFRAGGRLVVNALGSAGITSATGVRLDGNNTGTPGTNAIFQINPDMRSITR